MNITIFYFSGTGNTKWVSTLLKENLEKFDHNINLVSCDRTFEVNKEVSDADIVCIAFPIYASYAPKPIVNLIKNLPIVSNKKLIGISTAGYISGDVLPFTLDTLKSKGYIPQIYENIVVGNNMHLPGLSPLKVTNEKTLKKREAKIKSKISKIVNHINDDKSYLEGKTIFDLFFGLLQRFFSKNFESIAFKGFFADENCTKCKWCINNCPTKNISISGDKITFSDNCILCLRCYNYCPSLAVQSTNKTKNKEKYKRYKAPIKQ
jgi:ferredoxin